VAKAGRDRADPPMMRAPPMRRWTWLAAAPLLLGGAAAPVAVHARHNMHIAHARIVLEGTEVTARVRMFRDDLQKAVKTRVNEDSVSRAAVGAYVGKNFMVTANGARLAAELVSSGGETEGDQPVWWVVVQWKAAKPVTALGLKVHVLFDTFGDQQNIVILSRQPGDERRSLYFQPGDLKEQVVRF
jgi:hypothetical protein